MNFTYAFIALAILIVLIVYELKVWRIRALLSPGFYFGIMWALGVFGMIIFCQVDLFEVAYPEYINELNLLVGFTGLCFLFFTNKGKKKINQNSIELNFSRIGIIKFLSLVFLFAAVFDFIRLGGNLNMGAARANLVNISAGRPEWIGYIQTLSIPLSIYCGYQLTKIILNKQKGQKFNTIFLLIPLLANLIFSINIGGRVNFVYAFIDYLLGCAFALPLNQSFSQLKKPIITIALGCVFVLVFISYVASQRAVYYRGAESETQAYFNQRFPAIRFIYGPVEYVTSSYLGYQYRRIDAVDPTELGYGRYTFNGFINWTIPFSSRIGLENFSIAQIFDIYYYNQETYDYNRPFYYTTHSIYLTMIKDFGVTGALFCIIFLVYIAHRLFISIQKKTTIKRASQLFMFFIFWNYWSHSNFYGTLSSSILIPLYGFLIIDIANYFTKLSKK